MIHLRRAVRNLVVWAALAGGLVIMVLGQALIGLAVLAFGLWQLALIGRGRGGLFVDQREADKPGKPILRSK